MKIDVAAHEAALAVEKQHLADIHREGWESLSPGQVLRLMDDDLRLDFDWLEWLNFYVDRLIRPIRFKLSEGVYAANPEYWDVVFRYGRYLPAWVVSWILWFKVGKDSLL